MALATRLAAVAVVEHAPAPFSTVKPGPVSGPDAMRGTCTWSLDQFPDLTMTMVIWLKGWCGPRARIREKLNRLLPPSGRHFKYRQTRWFRVEDGQLGEHWATRHDLAAMLQLRVVTAPRLGALTCSYEAI